MEISVTDSKVPKVKKNIKLLIVQYFDQVLNRIDIDTESILIKLNKEKSKNEQLIDEMNTTRTRLIKEIKDIQEFNIQNCVDNQTINENDNINSFKPRLFTRYSFYLPIQSLKNFSIDRNRLGVLITTDFFVSDKQIEALNYLLSYITLADHYSGRAEHLKYLGYIENLYIIDRIKDAINKKESLIEIKENKLLEIDHLYIENGSIVFIFNKIEPCDFKMERFKNLKTIIFNRVLTLTLKSTLTDVVPEQMAISASGLREIEIDAFKNLSNLVRLDLSSNSLSRIKPGTLDYLHSLTDLNFCQNEITYLGQGLFKNMKNLQILNVSRNKLKSIDKNCFQGLSNLEHLDISLNSRLKLIDPEAFLPLEKIKHLKLSINKSDREGRLSLNIAQTLEELYMDCSVSRLNFINPLKLKVLNIGSEYIIIKGSIFNNLPDLEELCLNGVHLNMQKFPGHLRKLRKIGLMRVELKENSEDLLDDLPGLEEIFINCESDKDEEIGNDLNKLIKNLTSKKMKVIKVNEYHIHGDSTTIALTSDILNGLDTLKELAMYNSVHSFELEAFKSLVSLEKLDLTRNYLERLDENIFEGLVNLKTLELTQNEIKMIHPKAFSGLNRLEDLDLSDNQIETLDENAFDSLIELKTLNISGNSAFKVKASLFKCLSKLENLNLSEIKMSSIPVGMFSNLVNLKGVFLSECGLETLSRSDFAGAINLSGLFLNVNKLKNIDHVFSDLVNLSHLDIHHNLIENIDFKTLGNFKQFKFIDFSHNKLRKVDVEVLDWLSNTKNVQITFDNNPFESESGMGYKLNYKLITDPK